MPMTRRQAIAAVGGALAASGAGRSVMRVVPESARFTVAQEEGWYLGFTGVARSRGGKLVCAYLRSDAHLRTTTDIMVAISEDGGRTWKDHRSISHLDIHKDEAVWVSPEINALSGGHLAIICDRGQRRPGQNQPMLSQWQSKERGMWNYMFLSRDGGRTWSGPHKIDDVGGEPERIHELSNGDWVFTRTQSRPTDALKHPTPPWGPNYYMSVAVFSSDKGATWRRTVTVADSPLHGDCEVGIAELEPGHIIAVTRIGDGGGRFGQPSRILHSYDYGKTWGKAALAPFYGQRPIPGRLKSGKVLVTYRNAWGTSASYAFAFDPAEKFEFQPNSWIWDESRCQIRDGCMEIRTEDGRANSVEFGLYPLEDDDSSVEVEAELMVKEAQPEGCLIAAGAWVRFEPRRISLADRPAEGFEIDTTQWRRYRIAAREGLLTIHAGGELKLKAALGKEFTRMVRFGSRGYAAKHQKMRGHSLWRSFSAKVSNRRDYSMDWRWTPAKGYPDQFRRDRIVCLERNGSFAAGDGGYSGWTQLDDGTIVVVDYTRGDPPAPKPFVRAYRLKESDLA